MAANIIDAPVITSGGRPRITPRSMLIWGALPARHHLDRRGVIFAGTVQDMVVLSFWMRGGAKSLGQVVRGDRPRRGHRGGVRGVRDH